MPRSSSCSDTTWYGCRASSSSRSTSETRTRARTRGEAVGPPRSTAVAYPVRTRRPMAASIVRDEPDRKVVCRVLRSALGPAGELNVGRTLGPLKKHGARGHRVGLSTPRLWAVGIYSRNFYFIRRNEAENGAEGPRRDS